MHYVCEKGHRLTHLVSLGKTSRAARERAPVQKLQSGKTDLLGEIYFP
jgi:hypothetical protein